VVNLVALAQAAQMLIVSDGRLDHHRLQRRSSAGSFSMGFGILVDCRRAHRMQLAARSIGFSMLDASIDPSDAPARRRGARR
jgi:hypothetical protein